MAINSNIKTFLIKLAILVCLIIVVDYILGLGLKALFYKQKSGKYYKITHAIKDADEDIMIFGNSHASEHFNAPLMQRLTAKTTFNFGNQGQSILYTYPLVKSAMAHHQPKLVIVNMDHNELAYKEEAYERLSIFFPYCNINAVIDSAITLMPYDEQLKCRSFLYRYNSTLGNTILNTYSKKITPSILNQGYDPAYGDICKVNNTEVSVTSNTIKFDQNKLNYLIKLITILQSNNVKLLVTTTPIYNQGPKKNSTYHKKLQQILAKYHVPYLDEANSATFKGKCEYFVDDTHLNAKGARVWTLACSNYINSIMIAKN